jgi:hypothetical protein
MADIDLKDFAVIGLRSEIARLESEPAGLRTKLASLIGGRLDTPAPGPNTRVPQNRTAVRAKRRRNLSPEGRARIAETTRKRLERVRRKRPPQGRQKENWRDGRCRDM